jgi:DNA repair exonuclease SbcCD ATPase subunit
MTTTEILKNIGKEIQQLRGKKDTLLDMKRELETALEMHTNMEDVIMQGQVIVQKVALATQEKLKLSIEPIIVSALDIVYKEEAYGFEIDFEVKRNKTEASLYFTRGGNRYHPLSSSGFGVVDVAAFALRLALWNISKPPTRSTFILDEPFKHVSEDLQESVMEMVNVLSKKLGIQILLVTHNKEADVIEHSDKVFRVAKDKDGISQVKIIKENAI